MKLLLISLAIKRDNLDYPLASAALKTSILSDKDLKEQVQVEILNWDVTQDSENQWNSIISSQADMVGFSCYTWNRDRILELNREIRKHNPKIVQIVGGAEATGSPKRLQTQGDFDFIFSGEGEEIIVDFLKALLSQREPEDTAILKGDENRLPIPAEVRNFHELPSPIIANTWPMESQKHLLWELTRGCPYGCAFCFESRGSRSVRPVKWDRFIQEGKIIEKSSLEEVFVLDPTFNHDRERCKRILAWMAEREFSCHFSFEIRMEHLDEETVDLFSRIPCSLQAGLQSAQKQVCRSIKRPFKAVQFQRGAEMLRRYHVPFGLDLIYGLPLDDFEGYKNSLNFALKLLPSHLELFPLSLLEGTELYDRAEEWGITQGDSNFMGWQHPTFPEEDMRKARDLSLGVERFYSWAMAPEWLLRLCKSLDIEPVDLMMQYAAYVNENDREPWSFLMEKHLNNAERVPMAELITLYEAFQRIQKGEEEEKKILPETTQLLKLNYSPEALEELQELDDNTFLQAFESELQYWVIFQDQDGLAWETLSERAFLCLKELQRGSAIQEIDTHGEFSMDDLIVYGREQGFLR